jgi:hypothetical protein
MISVPIPQSEGTKIKIFNLLYSSFDNPRELLKVKLSFDKAKNHCLADLKRDLSKLLQIDPANIHMKLCSLY